MEPGTLTDKALLQQAAQGNEAAFGALFVQWQHKLFGFILSITKNGALAEDIVQEVFLKIWLQREKLEDVSNFSGYLFTVAQRYAIDQLRRTNRESALLNFLKPIVDQPSPSAETDLLRKELAGELHAAIEGLPGRQKEVYYLHQQQGMKHEEIAEMLGLSVSTVQNHMFRALENLREKLSHRYPQSGILLLAIMLSENYLKNFLIYAG